MSRRLPMNPAGALHTGSARRVDLYLGTGDLGAGPIGCLQCGPDGGRPALLVPGYTGSKEDFGPILDPLADAGLRVTAMDLPGQLHSPGPSVPGEYTPDRLAEAVLGVARAMGGQVLLLGHSFGGLVARAAVIAEPSRFASLVLLGSGPAALSGARRATMDRLDPVLASAGLPGVYAAMQAVAMDDPRYVEPPPDLAQFFERRFLAGSSAMLQGMADALRSEPDRVAELRASGVPVLVACGADDDAWPPAVQEDMARRLDAGFVVLPGAAHSPAVENPTETVAALLEFWQAGPSVQLG